MFSTNCLFAVYRHMKDDAIAQLYESINIMRKSKRYKFLLTFDFLSFSYSLTDLFALKSTPNYGYLISKKSE